MDIYVAKDDISTYLEHYGRGHLDGGHSGRYPWGSGKEPFQTSADFYSRVEDLRKQGLSDNQIAEAISTEDFKINTSNLKTAMSVAKYERNNDIRAKAQKLMDEGASRREAARQLGLNESTLRSMFNEDSRLNQSKAREAAEILKKEIDEKGIIEVGVGTEKEMGNFSSNLTGLSSGKMQEALYILKNEGYNVFTMRVPRSEDVVAKVKENEDGDVSSVFLRSGSAKETINTIAAKNDIDIKYVANHLDEVKSLGDYYTPDDGERWWKREYPASIDSKRVLINYSDTGGTDKDGVIELRPGVVDLDLGKSHYAQVRILVDGTHYLKGMAMYSDDIPEGYDIRFNTNKDSSTPKLGPKDNTVLKPISKDDPNDPFGAYIKANGQSHYQNEKGEWVLSPINKLREEGEWDTMAKKLSSQFVSKQPLKFIKSQVNATYADYMSEFEDIMSLTNPTVRKHYLNEFAESMDTAAWEIKTSTLPGQSSKVILPTTTIRDDQVYAPTYKNGTKVALIRYPHAGTFEIPILTVNNNEPESKKIFGQMTDAIGITPKTAQYLSGADFDGDSVTVIPLSDKVTIKNKKPLKELENFDPKIDYATTPEQREHIKLLTKSNKQREMGKISNLITDMTLQGAEPDELARAVKHSMVVIDAEKHKLDYKRSEKDNKINELKRIYQVHIDDDGNESYGGASTLISKRKREADLPEFSRTPTINKETGEIEYHYSGRTYVDKKGNTVIAKNRTQPKMLNVIKDANELSSGTEQEKIYANFINKVNALANKARQIAANTDEIKYNRASALTYAQEVEELKGLIDLSERNAPRERYANIIANSRIKSIIQGNPSLADKENKKQLNKISRRVIEDARKITGAKNNKFSITDRQWEAIQVGAISPTTLKKILRYTDADALRERSMPKKTNELSLIKQQKLRSMLSRGNTLKEIAESLGVSVSTVSKYARES